ncbi:polysaccharide biosynthesis/export family protein [Amylibacter sp.]|nr:polysaccharide biosynthesis/export family protein [Amylibacter sp.]MDB9740084.1 polysaccharide biosynthesis/export family protein [Amylibacter sp.]
MTNFKLIICCIASVLILNSCSKILEPVSLFGGRQDVASKAGQEEFEINIKSLTFNTAKKANNTPYSRRMVLTGSGDRANVLDEANFLKSNFPKPSSSPDYLIGIGDEISLIQLNEFVTEFVQWPSISSEPEYILGIGDELTYSQSNDSSIAFSNAGTINSDTLITTQGVIGSNGNILLFGLGNILAANRTLEHVRTEVRNILIRNGLAPNFQLEISDFQSKKAFVTRDDGKSETITLNNLPVTLKQLALKAGLSVSYENLAMVKLTRNEQEFRYTARQLFDLTAPEITIQDNDQIEIEVFSNEAETIQSTVGSKGNILLGYLGSIPAVNRTLADIYGEVSSILIRKGIKPNFQLELTNFVSQKAFLIEKNVGSQVVPLTSSAITLRELILENKSFKPSNINLLIISLKRNGQVFRMTGDQILDPKIQNVWIIDGDQIEIEYLSYKPGQVFALSGAGNAQVVFIDPSKRETLADILFAQNGAFNNLLAKRSEVYLLRGKKPSVAYHLDAQNVSRILVAAKTELRPSDIVYVADRPIISFSRTLSEILPLRILLQDIQNDNIP